MPGPNILDRHPRELEKFLHASVGEDRNGYAVTVLSAFARLGLDPWKETAELVTLGREAARARLATLLARFRDVPTLAGDHGTVAGDLSRLLPESPASASLKRAASTVAYRRLNTNGVIWAVLAIVFVMFQMIIAGGAVSGE